MTRYATAFFHTVPTLIGRVESPLQSAPTMNRRLVRSVLRYIHCNTSFRNSTDKLQKKTKKINLVRLEIARHGKHFALFVVKEGMPSS